MAKGERSIDPMDFSSIPRTRDFINSLPESERVCAEHGEAVVICLSDFVVSPGAGPPFGKAAFQACESAFNKSSWLYICRTIIDRISRQSEVLL